MTEALQWDFTIYQGADWAQPVLWLQESDEQPVDTDGYEFRMQIRRKYADAETSGNTLSAPMVSLSSDPPPDPLPEDPPLYGQIVVAGDGEFTLTIPASVTDQLPKGTWVYDVEAESVAHVVTRLLWGRVVVQPGVTRG